MRTDEVFATLLKYESLAIDAIVDRLSPKKLLSVGKPGVVSDRKSYFASKGITFINALNV